MPRPPSSSRRMAWALAMFLGAWTVLAGSVAAAQPAEPAQVRIEAPAANGQAVDAPGDVDAPESGPGHTSKAGAILFWVFALACVGGAGFVITRRNLIAAVMGMVGTFFAVAATYALLYAHFLAVIQVLVYAGAIMVLFVFVIMILNRPEDEPWGLVGIPGKALAGAAMAYLLYRLASVLWTVQVATDKVAAPGATVDGTDWGSTASVGKVLFTQYLFPFEAVSILLLIAVVGAIAVARPHQEAAAGEPDEPAAAEQQP